MNQQDFAFSPKALHYFIQLTKTMNYTQAAQLLGITQPALTQQIKKLEHSLGIKLFYSVGKKLHLSDAGKTVLSTVKEIDILLKEATDEIQQSSSATDGQISIGMLSSIDGSVITDFISDYYHNYPHIEVSLYMFSRKEIWDNLENNHIDLAIMYLPDENIKNWKTYKFKTINKECLLFLHHGNLNKSSVSLSETIDKKWVTYPHGYYLDQLIKESFRNQLVDEPKIVARFSDTFQLASFASDSLVNTALPSSFYYSHKKDIGLNATPFNPKIEFDLSFVYRKNKITIPRILNFINEFDLFLNKKNYNDRLCEHHGIIEG